MRLKALVALLLFVAAIGIVVMAAPATAIKPGDSVSYSGPGGYTVTFTKVPVSMLSKGGVSTMAIQYGSISQGEYQYYTENINYYTTSYQTYLYWGNPGNSLRLRIVSPDGYMFGPFYDSMDGSSDGILCVTLTRSSGIAQGVWSNEIYGYQVSGSQSYYIH